MTIISPLPFTISNGNPGDGSQVEANFAQIVADVNQNAASNSGIPSATQPHSNGDVSGSILFTLSNGKNFTVYLSGASTDTATSTTCRTLPYLPAANSMVFKVPYAGTISRVDIYYGSSYGNISLDFNINGGSLFTGGRITASGTANPNNQGNAFSSPSANNVCVVGDNITVVANVT